MSIKRKYSPVRSDDRLVYDVQGDVITVTHLQHQRSTENGEDGFTPVDPIETKDVFDFSSFPDGEANVSLIETALPINPFISVKRVDGMLEVEVINFHGPDATEAERFPEWEVIL